MIRLLNRLISPTGGWKRSSAVLSLVAVLTATWALAAGKPSLQQLKPHAISITAEVLPGFDRASLDKVRFGRLEWRGGLQLQSPSKHFGGWSGLVLGAKGRSLLSVSDAGTWMRARVMYKAGRLAAVQEAMIGPLKALSGKSLSRNRDRDAEALALLQGGLTKGRALIAFEQNDRIGVFPLNKRGVSKPQRYLQLPKAIKNNRRRNGLEAITVLRGGKYKGGIIAFLENQPSKDNRHRGWLLHRGRVKRMSLADHGGFSITDAAGLRDGSILVLERRFRWSEGVRMRLRYVAAKNIKPNAALVGEVLLEADMSQQIDNMEGLAVHQNEKGETIITVISDDNFNRFLQKTLLLQFALKSRPARKTVTSKPPR